MMKKRILISGGSGFLGSALVKFFVKEGYNVTALIRPHSSRKSLEISTKSVNTIVLTDDKSVEEAVAVSSPDVVIHTACAYGRNGESKLSVLDANVRLGLIMLQSAELLDSETTFLNVGTVLNRQTSDYALSKAQFSEWGRRTASNSSGRLKFINVQMQHMYGPGDDPSKFCTYIIQCCLQNVSQIPLTHGHQSRDFIYIDDVVSAFHALVLYSHSWPESSVDVDVGTGCALTIRELVELIHRLTGSSAGLGFGMLPRRSGDSDSYTANLQRMRSIHWGPSVSLTDGLNRTIQAERAEIVK